MPTNLYIEKRFCSGLKISAYVVESVRNSCGTFMCVWGFSYAGGKKLQKTPRSPCYRIVEGFFPHWNLPIPPYVLIDPPSGITSWGVPLPPGIPSGLGLYVYLFTLPHFSTCLQLFFFENLHTHTPSSIYMVCWRFLPFTSSSFNTTAASLINSPFGFRRQDNHYQVLRRSTTEMSV